MKRSDLRKSVVEALFREGDNVNQRTDWSLIFHAIMFEAFFAADFRLPVGLLATVCAFWWMLVGIRQNWRFAQLHESLVSHPDTADPLYVFTKSLNDSRTTMQWIKAVPIFTILIPGATLLTWVSLIIASIRQCKISVAAWLVVPLALAAAGLAAFLLRQPPKTATAKSADLLETSTEDA